MNLEIDLNADAGEINITLDNSLCLRAYTDDNKRVIYSSGFNRISDDRTFSDIQRICHILLTND